MPRFTIIVPCFNAEDTLPETLDSLVAQTFGDWEALLVDDGSTDATRLLIDAARHAEPRFRLIEGEGRGPAVARNTAARLANAPILAFCDADDLWTPDKLARLAQAFDDHALAAVYARYGFFDHGEIRTLSTVPTGPLRVPQLLGENPVGTMSNLAVRACVFASTGGFDETLVHNEDLEWLVRLVGEGHRTIGLQQTLVHYRTSRTGLSADLCKMQAGRQAAIASARSYGFDAEPRHEAVNLRYLARRALRVDAPGVEALRFALAGLMRSPAGFFSSPRRGALTIAGALAAPLLPRPLRRRLFAS
ncbi:glycosyltransferase family 2 protein [Roseicyclus sp. F158]|uniref:Glycosyltransferase family 2 protein n=1 Tax=Tropicimonas omnivorans TaxID=3075590 RepID=A0ABU3DH25_9RHOB|nr:glycosyltransferase family 2 protein [Roseicyclus sp. F158]MDT0682984.1 glycosyltransferase family 2 protein [Roseicyclus sp. F158]